MTSISISSQVTTKEPKTQTFKGDAVTKRTGLTQCPKESQTHKTGAGAKGKLIQMSRHGRMVDSHLKHHLIFLLKPAVLIGISRGGLFSYPFIFPAFGLSCPIHSYV